MPSENPSASRSLHQAIQLGPWVRSGAAALGLGAAGSGGAAVFITHLEAGPVALIASGVLFLLVAMGGVMPTRLKVGDNEAEWINEVQEAAVAVAVSAVADDQPKLNASLNRLNELAPSLATSIAALVHIARSYSLVEQATDGRDDVNFSTITHDGTVYMALEASNGNKALVQPMANEAIATTHAIDLLKESVSRGADLGINRMLLVLDDRPSGKFHAVIEKNSYLKVVVVDKHGIRNLGVMIRGIENLLGLDFD